MKSIGYQAMGEYGIPRRRYFRKGGDRRSHHVHAFQKGDCNITRHLAFRDHLRENPQDAARYGELKKRLAEKCGDDIQAYCDGKDSFVMKLERKALETLSAGDQPEPIRRQPF
jgi:GrpB-like predicted nucleotidyltransferase (UPF0157 family)